MRQGRRGLVFVAIVAITLLGTCGALAAHPDNGQWYGRGDGHRYGQGHGQGHGQGYGGSSVQLQQRYFAWMFGSSTNPLLADNFCGELVGGEFMLTAAIESGVERSCTVPFGVPVIASPAGCFDWFPIGSLTDAQVIATRDADCPPSVFTEVTARLDGRPLDVARSFATTGAYTIPVADGSLIKTEDPTFPSAATWARAASMGWILRLAPLAPGRHRLQLSDVVDGSLLSISFTLTVRAPWNSH